jgi:hypothetical protein
MNLRHMRDDRSASQAGFSIVFQYIAESFEVARGLKAGPCQQQGIA